MSLINFFGFPEYLYQEDVVFSESSEECVEVKSCHPHALWSIDDLVFKVFSYLEFTAIGKLSLTCKRFKQICLSKVMRAIWIPNQTWKQFKKKFKRTRMERLKVRILNQIHPTHVPEATGLMNFLHKIFSREISAMNIKERIYSNAHQYVCEMHLIAPLNVETTCGRLHFPRAFELTILIKAQSSITFRPFNVSNKVCIGKKTLSAIKVAAAGFEMYSSDPLCAVFVCGGFLACHHPNSFPDSTICYNELSSLYSIRKV